MPETPETPDPLAPVVAFIRRRQREHPGRLLFGFVGAPGSGKSTAVERLVTALGPAQCVVVPMDGFHLANRLLDGTPLAARKGAPDTFDAAGYVHLLRRLAAADEPVVYAPAYERSIEEPVAGAIAVPAEVQIVLTEGNYLLLDEPPWNGVRQHLDAVWYLDTPREVRLQRLTARHIRFGKAPDAARAWALGPDEANAVVIEGSRAAADHRLPWG